MQSNPYLMFEGRCEEAIEFYRRALGAEVTMMMRFRESPDQSMVEPGSEDKILHSTLNIGGSRIMASDGRCQGNPSFQGFALTLSSKDASEAERCFNALADGGQVQMPLTRTFFSPSFGMVADRFGVPWMVMAEQG